MLRIGAVKAGLPGEEEGLCVAALAAVFTSAPLLFPCQDYEEAVLLLLEGSISAVIKGKTLP